MEPVTGNRLIFFRSIFGQLQGIVCLSFRSQKGSFTEEYFRWPDEQQEMLVAVERHADTHDCYFCPQLLDTKKRAKEHVVLAPNVWADLDFCTPDKMLLEPTVVVESSPDRFQAYWILDRPVDPDVAQELSKRIAYKHADQGADRSGWDLTQLLRVPQTPNFKHIRDGTAPQVNLVYTNHNRYRPEDFDEYPKSPEYMAVDIPMPELDIPDGKAEQLLQDKREELSPYTWTLFSEVPDVPSWSEVLWKLLMMLYETGYTREEVYIIASSAACNKYARDGRPAVQLWKEVCRAEARAELHHKLLVPKPEEVTSLLSDAEKARVDNQEDTFVERYIKWASKLGDAAPQYHQAGAFVALSSLLSGSVLLPTSYGVIVPNIWFMILADTTLTRKTTSMDIAIDLVMEVDDDVVMATDGSIEGLLASLAARPNRPSVFLRDEFSGLLEQMTRKDYMAGMPELFTKLYDGKMMKRVLRKETVEVRDPRLVVFAGGIKQRVTSLLTFEMVGSGFMPRFIFVTAISDLARIKPIGPPTDISVGERDTMLAELTDIHKHYNRTQTLTIDKLKSTISRNVITEAALTADAWIRYNTLETRLLELGLKTDRADVMTPIGDRLAKSVLKCALLIAASRQRGEDIVIEEIDILHAAKYGEQWYAHALEVMEDVGKGESERRIDTIYRAIIRNPAGISRSHLMQAYHLTAHDASAMFETLEQRGVIVRKRAGRTELLTPTALGRKEAEG
jgi:hypothetical protein